MSIPAGHPSTQYLQAVQGMAPAARSISAASARIERSPSVRGFMALNRAVFCSICSRVDMPERIMATPGKLATNRRAQEAMDASGSAFCNKGAQAERSEARLPPRMGSMTTTGLPCRTATS